MNRRRGAHRHPRPVYIQAAQGGATANSRAKSWLEARNVSVAADGSIVGPAVAAALLALRRETLTPAARQRSAYDALRYATGLNLVGQDILGEQRLTRHEILWLATAANKWFLREDDLGSIEVGNRGDLVVLDRDCFHCSDEDFKRTQSLLTIVGGNVVHGDGGF